MNQYVKFLQQFLNHNGSNLAEDGVFGAKTTYAIQKLPVQSWVKTALKEVGTLEVIGNGSNKRIERYHTIAGLPNAKDHIPWCGSALAFVMFESIGSMPASPAMALSWAKYGVAIDYPIIGSIAVKSRKGGGHCGIVLAKSGEYILLIGGNQSDAFNIKKYKASSFQHFRYPRGEALPSKTLAFLSTSSNSKEA